MSIRLRQIYAKEHQRLRPVALFVILDPECKVIETHTHVLIHIEGHVRDWRMDSRAHQSLKSLLVISLPLFSAVAFFRVCTERDLIGGRVIAVDAVLDEEVEESAGSKGGIILVDIDGVVVVERVFGGSDFFVEVVVFSWWT